MTEEKTFGVWLMNDMVGSLTQRGDYTQFRFLESYVQSVSRPILGLSFEQDLQQRHAAALRLPTWFSNLLPEGRLREWIAADRGVSAQREMELLAQVGHDLPGAVRVAPIADATEVDLSWDEIEPPGRNTSASDPEGAWRFSLAGVALKFSMLNDSDRLTLPAAGLGGDWIVKLPDRVYPHVPANEFAMMKFAGAVGIEVPETRLIHRDEIRGLPDGVWSTDEDHAYAVKRFDRDSNGPIHIEDLAQVTNRYADQKYQGNYETVGALTFRGHDVESLREFARRLVFSVLIMNGDAHLKNWSLIYRNGRAPSLAPAYDLVSTRWYMGASEKMALKFAGRREFDRFHLRDLGRLDRKLGSRADLEDVGRDTLARALTKLPETLELLSKHQDLAIELKKGMERLSLTMAS